MEFFKLEAQVAKKTVFSEVLHLKLANLYTTKRTLKEVEAWSNKEVCGLGTK